MGGACSEYGERRDVYSVLWGNMRERDPGIDGSIILRGIFRKWDVWLWIDSSCVRRGTVGGHLRMR